MDHVKKSASYCDKICLALTCKTMARYAMAEPTFIGAEPVATNPTTDDPLLWLLEAARLVKPVATNPVIEDPLLWLLEADRLVKK